MRGLESLRPSFFLLPLLCALPAGAAGDANRPPRIRIDHERDSWANIGDTVCFRVRATDPEGDSVSLRVTPLEFGVIFAPAASAGPEVEREFSCEVHRVSNGVRRFVFEAWDDVNPAHRAREVVTIRVTGTSNLAWGGAFSHSTIDLGDVTGDGQDDVVVSTRNADSALVDTGAVYVWSGLSQPSGPPSATLSVPNAVAGQKLGHCAGDGTKLADVTGDGVLDIVVGSSLATAHGAAKAGAVYVWHGGANLTGAKAPDAELVAPAEAPSSYLGGSSLSGLGEGGDTGEQGILLCDLDGDGADDLLASAPLTSVNGLSQAGAVYGWVGSALTGVVEANVVLTSPTPQFGLQFGGGLGQQLQIRELTGDGNPDVVVGVPNQGPGGEILVWAGGASLTASPPPTARLLVSQPVGLLAWSPSGVFPSMLFDDVTGDGVTDVIAQARYASALYVFEGGQTLLGDVAPRATLEALPAAPLTQMVWFGIFGARVTDVTLDGIPDVLVPYGSLYVFAGGDTMTGSVQATAWLRGAGSGPLELADVTGDGIRDFVVGRAPIYPVGEGDASAPIPAVSVWHGRPGLSGALASDAQLLDANPVTGYQLRVGDITGDGIDDIVAGADYVANAAGSGSTPAHVPFWAGGPLHGAMRPTNVFDHPSGPAFLSALPLADVTGDGVLDLLVEEAFPFGTGTPPPPPAEFLHWKGGAGISSATAPDATLVSPKYFHQWGQQFADRNGDGVLDFFAVRGAADPNDPETVLFGWHGGPSLAGPTAPSETYLDPSAQPGDGIGFIQSPSVFMADLDGDGQLDVLSGSQYADVNGVADAGAMFLWTAAAAFWKLTVPTAQAGDMLGY